jgi:hypothetical protein
VLHTGQIVGRDVVALRQRQAESVAIEARRLLEVVDDRTEPGDE